MRNTWKKTAAFLLAFTLAAVPLSQTGVKGGLFGRSGIVAYAAEESESFSTNTSASTYTGDHFKIEVTDKGDGDGFTLCDEGDRPATITALYGETINKIELVRGYYGGEPHVLSDTAVMSQDDETFTFTNINATSVVLDRCTGDDFYCQIKQVKVYFSEAAKKEISDTTIVLGSDYTILSVRYGDTIVDPSEYDITYGTDTDHSSTTVPTVPGTYYAYVTAKDTSPHFNPGTAKSTQFVIKSNISTAAVNLNTDNTVASITVGSNTITDLSGFDITYGVSDTDHTATAVPTDVGTYYAYVTPKESNTGYTGTAKSDSFEVAAAPTMTSASVTLNDGFGLNFYVDDITDATGYTVMFDGVCDENGTEAALTEKDGKFFATANVNAKDIKENIAATLYKDGVATDVTLTSSVDAYLTAALATDGLDDKTKALIEATQLYGCTADNYFNNAENDFNQMFGDFLTYAGLESDQTPLYAAINNAVANDNVNDEKVSLVLNSKVKLRIYSDNGTNENNYGKYSEITGLTPLTMGQNQTVGGCSVSGYTWVDRVLEKNEIDKNYYMAMALASYMYAAEKYAIVDVASVTLDQSALTLTAGGDTATLTATVLPDNATNKTVTWSSDNEAVATVVNGVVIPVGAGTATITATAGGKTAECTVSVTPASILNDGDVIIVNGYYQNNSSTFSGQGTYNDGSITDVSTSLNGNIDSMSFNYDENKLIVSMKRSTSSKTVTIDLLTGTYTEAKSGHPTTSSRITFSKLTINGVTVPLTAQ